MRILAFSLLALALAGPVLANPHLKRAKEDMRVASAATGDAAHQLDLAGGDAIRGGERGAGGVRRELSRKDHEAGGAVHDGVQTLHRWDHEAGGAVHDAWSSVRHGDKRREDDGRGPR